MHTLRACMQVPSSPAPLHSLEPLDGVCVCVCVLAGQRVGADACACKLAHAYLPCAASCFEPLDGVCFACRRTPSRAGLTLSPQSSSRPSHSLPSTTQRPSNCSRITSLRWAGPYRLKLGMLALQPALLHAGRAMRAQAHVASLRACVHLTQK